MTLSRPMFPPSRRQFLTQAAGVAAGGAVLALASASSKPAAAAPAWHLDALNVSPALLTAARALGDAHDRLKAAAATFDAADAKVTEWRATNPEPDGRRQYKNWIRRATTYRDSVSFEPWESLTEAERVFHRAQIAVAKVPAANMSDLRCKAAMSCIYDEVNVRTAWGNVAPIGRSVAWGLMALSGVLSSREPDVFPETLAGKAVQS